MDKNSIVGFILIGVIFFGFTWYQSNQYKKQREYQAQLDSVARAEQIAAMAGDSLAAAAQGAASAAQDGGTSTSVLRKYRDSLLNSRYIAEPEYVTLGNGLLELVVTTKGAQPYTARLDEYRTYDSTDLYLIKPGYSDFNIGETRRTNKDAIREQADWLGTAKELLNRKIAAECDRIVAGLYEYWVCYDYLYKDKTTFVPFPIKAHETKAVSRNKKLKIFIGINKTRNEYKGTDIMLKAAEDVERAYPDKIELIKAESVPFNIYQKMMDGSDAILDQLYSYTPAMNALLAMSKGIICIGGGEEEQYGIIHEDKLRPIINVTPDYQSVYENIKRLATASDEEIINLKQQSIEYVAKHHNYIKVAKQYSDLYEAVLSNKTK